MSPSFVRLAKPEGGKANPNAARSSMEPKPHVCSPRTPWPLANPPPPDRQLALVRSAYAYAPAARTRAAALYSRACLPACPHVQGSCVLCSRIACGGASISSRRASSLACWEIYLQAGLLRGGRLPFLRPCRRPSSSSCTVLGGRSFTMCDWSVIRVNRGDGPRRHLEPNRPVCWLSMTVLHSPALSFLQARWLWLDLKLHGSA
jgi:hypothetical protein